jgi:hypothetical protein
MNCQPLLWRAVAVMATLPQSGLAAPREAPAAASPCEAALAFVEGQAASRGWGVDAQCRTRGAGGDMPVGKGRGAWTDVATDVDGAREGKEAEHEKRTMTSTAGPAPAAPHSLGAGWSVPAQHFVLLSGPARLRIEHTPAAGPARYEVVSLRLVLRSTAWVAARPLAAGTVLLADDVRLAEQAWPAGITPVGAATEPPAGRLRAALRGGDLIDPRRLLPADQLPAGTEVLARRRHAALQVTVDGWLVAAAAPGERTRVQLRHRREVLDGVLVDARTVEIDD